MPNSSKYSALITDLDVLVRKLTAESRLVNAEVGSDVLRGGRLTTAIRTVKEQSSGSVTAVMMRAAMMRLECDARRAACQKYEAELAAYEAAMAQYRSASAAHSAAVSAHSAAVAATKPGEPVKSSPPGPGPTAPTAPVPPPYWSR